MYLPSVIFVVLKLSRNWNETEKNVKILFYSFEVMADENVLFKNDNNKNNKNNKSVISIA